MHILVEAPGPEAKGKYETSSERKTKREGNLTPSAVLEGKPP